MRVARIRRSQSDFVAEPRSQPVIRSTVRRAWRSQTRLPRVPHAIADELKRSMR
jgi:hypothetical protein